MRDEEGEVLALHGWQRPAFKLLHQALAYPFKLRERFRAQTRESSGLDARHQLEQYEQNVSSQQGEDGILREIFYRVGPESRYFVEFGTEDGSVCNTALLASRYRWGGLYIEANSQDVQKLRERWAARSDITVREAFVTAENIAGLLADGGVPNEFDLLSIDVDGNDYWVWKALANYRPRAVVIEYNAAYPPPRRWIMAYDPKHNWDGTTHFGASLSAYQELGSRLGYALLGTDRHGLNAFFLRRDLLPGSGLREVSAEEGYHPPHYGILGLRFPYRPGAHVSQDDPKSR
ncbi:MAG: hypothetical protein WCB99_07180 [Candidatus Cybelea sp.]|jgi:hypothetical protein